MDVIDYLIIGSGCSGAMAAQTLVEAGVDVTMLDVGVKPSTNQVPNDKGFLDIRKTELDQHRYFLGEQMEGIKWGGIHKGAQVTPPRNYMLDSVNKYLPIQSKNFSSLESLGYGGLGIGWGLQCWEYSPSDFERVGIDGNAMDTAYEIIAKRIGISATKDTAATYTIGGLKNFQKSVTMDRNNSSLYKKYITKIRGLNKKGFFLGRTPLALLTKDVPGRKKYAYNDMDFYSDEDKSAWRPWITVNQLKTAKNFTYIGGYLVVRFKEQSTFTEVHCLATKDDSSVVFKCKNLILASGALGSARIVLRSLGNPDTRLPILCNPYSYIPCLQPKFWGKAAEIKKTGFAQLSLFLDEPHTNTDVSVASIYSYQSLMMFRLINQVPLGFSDTRHILRYLMSGLIIMGVHHPDKASSKKYIKLTKNDSSPTKDQLYISYQLSQEEKADHASRERKFMKTMRKLGAYPIKKIDPGYGSSVHYAGTLPFSKHPQPLTLNTSGKLHNTKSIYVADSSGFNYLPAKGLTFTLMANAHLVAEGILKNA